jgi:hypothetical protein
LASAQLASGTRPTRPHLGAPARRHAWLLPWYAVWAVALAAIEEDAAAWVLTLALCAYLLPDRVPI